MPKRKPSADEAKNQAVEEIAGLVDAFCKEHLNNEYAEPCRRLTEKLGRKRPPPLVSGKPNTWACAIWPERIERPVSATSIEGVVAIAD